MASPENSQYRASARECLRLTAAVRCGLIAHNLIGRFKLKAIVVREFGPPNVMKFEEVPTPEPGPGEVLIKVHAVSVNRTLDTVARAGKYARPVSLPMTPGVDPSGVIIKLGPDVTTRKIGDRVTVQLRSGNESGADSVRNLGMHVWGGYAEYVRCEASRTALVHAAP
jgi:NADPH2:quinone reductase